MLADGQADFIGLAHGALTEPHWVNKVRRGEAHDIVPCIGCNECLFAGFKGGHYQCAVNPQCYAEDFFPVLPIEGHCRLLVVGAGPGGMECAITAAERGVEVELWERSARLGGALWAAGGPTFKSDVADYATYLVNKVYRSGITVRTMKDATAAEILGGDWDKVVLATGARHTMPPIPGIDGPTVVSAGDLLTGRAEHGDRVVVIGAGLVGCETAAMCAQRAHTVTVVESLPKILMSVEHCRNNELALAQLLEDSAIEFITDAAVSDIGTDHVTVQVDGATRTLEADTCVIATGYTPNDELFAQLVDRLDVSMIGDAANPDSILAAVHQGFHLARGLEPSVVNTPGHPILAST